MMGSTSSSFNEYYFVVAPQVFEDGVEDFVFNTTGVTTDHEVGSERLHSPDTDYQFWWVVPSDFLRTKESLPQVRVWIDDVLAVCRGDCSFEYATAPSITSAAVADGKLTLTGTGFIENDLMTTIDIGQHTCEFESITATEIVCVLPTNTVAGDHSFAVTNVEFGAYSIDESITLTIPYDVTISTISPSEGATTGGTYLTITGTGFSSTLNDAAYPQSVTIGNATCEIKTTAADQIQCITSAQGTGTDVTITVNGKTATSTAFSYNSALDMTITSVTPLTASTIYQTTISIAGTNFGSDSTAITVKIGNEACLVKSASFTSSTIDCVFLGSPAGTYTLAVYKGTEAIAYKDDFQVVFELTSVTPTSGSIYGGTQLELKGKGFTTISGTMVVLTGPADLRCDITEQPDDETIRCVTAAKPDDVEADTAADVIVLGKVSEISQCGGTCAFTWDSTRSPNITAISATSGVAGDSLIIDGENFGVNSANIVFKIGGQTAVATSVSDSQFTAVVPQVLGGVQTVTLSVTDMGTGHVPAEYSEFTVGLSLGSISPRECSQGGESIEISGSGFTSSTSVTFGSVACEQTSVTNDKLTCRVGAYSDSETAVAVTVTEGDSTITCATLETCGLSFLSAKTPTISGVSGNLVISGSFLADSGITVSLGGYSCTTTAISTTEITCTPTAPPGTYSVEIHVSGHGYATGSFQHTVTLQATVATGIESSYAGGQEIEVTGTGLSTETSVKVCDLDCEVQTATGDSLTCLTPLLLTSYSVAQFDFGKEPEVVTGATPIGTLSSLARAFDGDESTYSSGNSYPYWDYIGIDMGEGKALKLTGVEFRAGGSSLNNYKRLADTQVQVSNDDTNWETVHTFTAVNSYWNKWTNTGDTIVRYIRLANNNANSIQVNELRIKGHSLLTVSEDSSSCDIVVSSSASSLRRRLESVTSGSLTYTPTLTPVITSLSPTIGTVAGGTVVTIGGTGFSDQTADVTVLIDEIPCTVTAASATSITCTTGARPNFVTPSLSVSITGKGVAATSGLTYLYADYWSDEATWGGVAPPREGESVYIPKGQNIILDVATPKLVLILVEGVLTVDDQPGRSIDAEYILVQGGHFIVGTEDTPFENDFTITLHGNRNSEALPTFGNKVLAVQGGTLDLHGKTRSVVWTFLDSTAEVGSTQITVMDAVDWVAGEEIVIAPTSFESTEAERRTITAVDGTTLTLNSALEYKHYAATETYGDHSISMRAEVGLLTRNVKVRGSDEGLEEQHGSQIMMASHSDTTSVGRVENIEVFNAGQAFAMGRYPLHFHMLGQVDQSYIRGNSIHDTFNRAVTIHGVSHLRVQNNVAYNTMGHTFFVEDGIETKNIIENNLGMVTRASHSLLNTDATPATFWITNFDNIIRGNHAAGSERYGFWFDPPDNPTGPSSTTTVCPQFVPLGEFDNNEAHSNGKYGLRIFHGHIPLTNPCSPAKNTNLKEWWTENPAITAEYTNFVGWKNKKNGAIIDDAGDVRFLNFTVADNKVCGIEMGWTEFSQPFNSTRIKDALVIGNSANTEGGVSGAKGIITAQTDGMLVENVSFFNFAEDMWPIGDESKSFHPNVRDFGGRLHKLSGLSFTNSHKRIHWEIPYRGIFEILDDSYTGTANAFVATHWNHLETPECVHEPELYNAVVCDGTAKIRRVLFHNQSPFSDFNNIKVEVLRTSGSDVDAGTSLNVTEIPMVTACSKKFPLKSWAVPLVTGYDYNITWGTRDWTHINIEIDTFEDSEHVILQFPVVDVREHYTATRGVTTSNTTVLTFKNDTLVSSDNAGTYDWDEGYFSMVLSGIPAHEDQFKDINVDGYRCWGDSCVEEEETTDPTDMADKYWSDASIWPGAALPVEGQSVFIEESWNLILDIDETPILNTIEVKGNLTFLSTKSLTLKAQNIFVNGGALNIASESEPLSSDFTHTIELHGEASDLSQIVLSNDVEAGNKVIANIGYIGIFGAQRTSWVKLVQNAMPDDNFLFVEEVDWTVGDTIVLAASGFAGNETETFEITTAAAATEDSDWSTKQGQRSSGRNGAADTLIDSSTNTQTISGVTKLTLATPVKYYHSGTKQVINSIEIDIRTEVGLLNRNVKIVSNGDWSGTIVTTYKEVATTEGTERREGLTTLSNVQIENCGQEGTSRGAVRFESSSQAGSSVTNSVFRDSKTWAVHLNGAQDVTINDNVIYNTLWRGVVVQKASNSEFKRNAVVGIVDRGVEEAKIDTPSGFFSCYGSSTCDNVAIQDNVVSSYQFGGFITSASACDTTELFSGNTAHSGNIGWVIADAGATCLFTTSFTAFANEAGLGAFAGAREYRLSNLKLADNLLGFGMKTGFSGDDIAGVFTITDSVIVGRTQHTECSNRIGFYTSIADDHGARVSLTEQIKTPLHNVKGNAKPLGSATMSKITLANFLEGDLCDGSEYFAFQTNPLAPDYTQPQYFSEFTVIPSGSELKYYMNDPKPGWANDQDCGIWTCTGLWNNLIVTSDTSILSLPGTILPNNPGVAKNQLCELKTVSNSYECVTTGENYYEVLIFESLDADAWDRTVSPINITTYGVAFQTVDGTGFSNDLNSFMDHGWDGFYTSQKRMSRFPSLLYSGYYYNITLTGSHPKEMRFRLQGTQNRNQAVVLALNYGSPEAVRVWMNGEEVEPIAYSAINPVVCSLSDSHGTNRWFHEDTILQFVMRNEVELLIKVSKSIMLNMRIDMTVSEFYSNNGDLAFIDKVAALLNIPSYRIRIASVASGSVILDIYIYQDSLLEGTEEGEAELDTVLDDLIEAEESGELEEAIGAEILDMTATTSPDDTEEEETTEDEEDTSFFEEYFLVLICGAGLIVIIFLVLVIYFWLSKRKYAQIATPVHDFSDPHLFDAKLFDKYEQPSKGGHSARDMDVIDLEEENTIRDKPRSQTTKNL